MASSTKHIERARYSQFYAHTKAFNKKFWLLPVMDGFN